jgi:hypothetical protein
MPVVQPTNIDEIKKDSKMMAAYLKYATSRHTLNEVMFYFDKGNAQGIYPKYLDEKSSSAVNVDANTTKPAKLLADRNDWGNAAWAAIIRNGKTEVAQALNGDIGIFLASKDFLDYAKKEKMGDPSKAAKLLGISDLNKLKDAMEAQVVGDHDGAKKLFEALLKAEKVKDKAEDIMKALTKAGLA